MPHLRKRYVENRIRKSLTFSSILGVLGQRQVGKTTLLEKYAKTYCTFDREGDLLEAESSPQLFLENRRFPFAIDESQLCPRIFPALKEAVRITKTPGSYLLSGSVRFTSREMIRESLTGRIINIELLPFTIRESHSSPMSKLVERIFSIRKENDLVKLYEKGIHSSESFNHYLKCGGLPGVAFFRDHQIRKDKFEAQVDTLLNRDIRLVIKTTLPFSQLRALLKFLALNQGSGIELKEAAEYSQISTVTLKRILYAFEALFLIRPIVGSGGEKKIAYFLEDQGMATWLAGDSFEVSSNILRGIYANLRQELFYSPDSRGSISHYRTKHGVNIPLVFESAQGTLGVIPCPDRFPPPKTLGSALAFLKKNSGAKVVIAVNHDVPTYKTPDLFFVPYYWMV